MDKMNPGKLTHVIGSLRVSLFSSYSRISKAKKEIDKMKDELSDSETELRKMIQERHFTVDSLEIVAQLYKELSGDIFYAENGMDQYYMKDVYDGKENT